MCACGLGLELSKQAPGQCTGLLGLNVDPINKPLPFKGLNIWIPNIAPMKGRGFIN